MPTGGVDLENCGDFIRAGAVAVGVGSALVRNEWVENGEWRALSSRPEDLRPRCALRAR